MSAHIVRLGSPRSADEGLRIGTVRRPPRGVRKADYAARDFYDVWMPELAPAAETIKLALRSDSAADWKRFVQRYRAEMTAPGASRLLDLLAALSHQTNFAVGCYCADANRCHRSLLALLLADRGALIAPCSQPGRTDSNA